MAEKRNIFLVGPMGAGDVYKRQVYALGVADKFIRSGSVKKALVIGADLNSRKLDETDSSTVVLFGDCLLYTSRCV